LLYPAIKVIAGEPPIETEKMLEIRRRTAKYKGYSAPFREGPLLENYGATFLVRERYVVERMNDLLGQDDRVFSSLPNEVRANHPLFQPRATEQGDPLPENVGVIIYGSAHSFREDFEKIKPDGPTWFIDCYAKASPFN
jgi:hypothetical protein